jgi:predicted DCC family thiol-disulfide oxidoreductase YuxK
MLSTAPTDPDLETFAGRPGFDGASGLIVFDHECVFCSSFARFVHQRDRRGLFRFTPAQGAFGQALYARYGLDTKNFSTNLVIVDGRLFTKLDGFATVMRTFDRPWRWLSAIGLLPPALAEPLYDGVARNRYRIFGRYDTCMVPSPEFRARMVS